MSHDGLLPKVFGKVHKKYGTPVINTIIVTIVGALLCGFFPVGILGQLVSWGTLMAFSFVCFGVLVLRYKQPSLHRPFKVPFFPWIPLIGTLFCIIQMIVLPSVTWIQAMGWIFAGYIIYFGYGIKHSTLRKKKKKA